MQTGCGDGGFELGDGGVLGGGDGDGDGGGAGGISQASSVQCQAPSMPSQSLHPSSAMRVAPVEHE